MTRPLPHTTDPDRRPDDEIVIEPETNERAEDLKERVSTVLSTLAMLAISGGSAWALWDRLGPLCVVVGGFVLAISVGYSDAARRPKSLTVKSDRKKSVPGPSDPGRLHAKGPGATS